MLVISAYTANLASFLVSTKKEQFNVANWDDAVNAGYTACILGGGAFVADLRESYPELKIIESPTTSDVYSSLNTGECRVAGSLFYDFQIQERSMVSNENCKLLHDGRIQYSNM